MTLNELTAVKNQSIKIITWVLWANVSKKNNLDDFKKKKKKKKNQKKKQTLM